MGVQPADPLAKGVVASARQSVRDLFTWKQRVVLPARVDGTIPCEWHDPPAFTNPLKLLGLLDWRGWTCFIVGFLAWTADAFDFHALSIQTTKLAGYYGKSKGDITTAITLTLLLRSVGAALIGIPSDKWGRKWPLAANMIILGLLQIATIYCTTFPQFLAVRSLFGLFMGGIYGNAVAMALEHCPVEARGLMSGIMQQGYSFGYVLAAVTNLGVGGSQNSWKTAFWAGAGFSIGVGVLRIFFPESQQFLEARKAGRTKAARPGAFWRETKKMLAQEWRLSIYCIILMTWFNFYSHTTQDSYTTFVKVAKGLDNAAASRASILMKTGACVGGTIIGYVSQYVGRRRTIILSALLSGCVIPAWVLTNTERTLSVSGFFLQFFVQGAWGVIPIHLNELSPPAFRSSFPGISYQLGNMISSPSAQIVNEISERVFVTRKSDGKRVEAYGPVMAIATAIIATGIICTSAIGPERIGRHFEHAVAGVQGEDVATAKSAALEEDPEKAHPDSPHATRTDSNDSNEKPTVDEQERR